MQEILEDSRLSLIVPLGILYITIYNQINFSYALGIGSNDVVEPSSDRSSWSKNFLQADLELYFRFQLVSISYY